MSLGLPVRSLDRLLILLTVLSWRIIIAYYETRNSLELGRSPLIKMRLLRTDREQLTNVN